MKVNACHLTREKASIFCPRRDNCSHLKYQRLELNKKPIISHLFTFVHIFSQVHVDFVDAGNVIKIEGPTEEVEKAREVLEVQAKNLIDTTDFAEINVDAKYHKHIIGKGGSTGEHFKTIICCVCFE